MEKYLSVIKKAPLFGGVAEDELRAMLQCLGAEQVSYKRDQFIFHAGDATSRLGLVLSGRVHVIREDFWGNRSLFEEMGPGELFGEVYACTPGAVLNVSVRAEEAVVVLYLDVHRVLTTCSRACEFHGRLIRNLLSALAARDLLLMQKLTHVSRRSTRDKLLSYLSAESQRQGSATVTIPFNRQQLADYLFVERSAMSSELGKMRDEGLLSYHKNVFTLCQPE